MKNRGILLGAFFLRLMDGQINYSKVFNLQGYLLVELF